MKIGIGKFNKKITLDPTAWSHKGGENLHCAVIKYLMDKGHQVVLLTSAEVENVPGLECRPCSELGRPLSDWSDLDAVVMFCGSTANDQYATRSLRRLNQPVVNMLNELQTPWLYILADPRYWPRWLDMENKPRAILSQVNGEFSTVLNYDTAIFYFTYCACEAWQFYGMKRDLGVLQGWKERPLDVVVCSHEHKKEKLPSKFPAWDIVHNYHGSCEIWGQWESVSGAKYKGIASRTEIQSLLQRGRTTFMVPIWNGWITPKLYEACLAGTVPIFHGRGGHQTYDAQCHSGISLDHPWRVQTAAEFDHLVNTLTVDDAEKALHMVTDDMLSGQLIERELVDRLRNIQHLNDDPIRNYVLGEVPLCDATLMCISQSGDTKPMDYRRAILKTNGVDEDWATLVGRLGEDGAHELMRAVAMKEVPGEMYVKRHVQLPTYEKRRIT